MTILWEQNIFLPYKLILRTLTWETKVVEANSVRKKCMHHCITHTSCVVSVCLTKCSTKLKKKYSHLLMVD